MYEFIDKTASGWREHDRLDVILLRALCRLSIDNPEIIKEGFTSLDIVEVISQIRGSSWSDSGDPAQQSRDVRIQWNKLLKTWDAKIEGLTQGITDARLKEVPLLKKTEGGGAGRPSRYRIELLPAEESNLLETQVSASQELQNNTNSIKYICEDIEDAGPLARIFSRGYQLIGWRRWLYISMLAAPLLLGWLLFVNAVLGITMWEVVGAKTALTSIISFAIVYLALWYTIGSLLNMVDDKIVLAPWWMQSDEKDCLLEHRSPPRYQDKSVIASRYTARCPLCGGTVSAKSGGFEFWSRIIGKCENAPREHVYSFDHVSRNGKFLR